MSLEEKMNAELIDAMKAKDTTTLTTLRMLKAALMNLKIDKKTEDLPEAEVLTLIQKQVKQRRESIESFEKAGRTELAQKEKAEIDVLLPYLPKQLDESEIELLLKKAIDTTGAKVKADAGKVMKEIMPLIKGKADGKTVNKLLMGKLA